MIDLVSFWEVMKKFRRSLIFTRSMATKLLGYLLHTLCLEIYNSLHIVKIAILCANRVGPVTEGHLFSAPSMIAQNLLEKD
jgi:hypothetical protein